MAYSQAPAKPAGYSAGVKQLQLCNGVIWQQNPSNLWFQWTGTTWTPAGGQASNPCIGPPPAPGIKAAGNKTVSTLDGSALVVLGGQLSGFETNQAPVRSAAIAAQATTAWFKSTWTKQHAGTNTVRFHLDACSYLALPCAPSWQTWVKTAGNLPNRAYVKQAVAQALAAGLLVDLDIAWSAPSGQNSIGQPGFLDTNTGPAMAAALAADFGNNPAVFVEPFNEPYGQNVYADWMAPAGRDANIIANGGAYSPWCRQNNTTSNNQMTCFNSVPYTVFGEATFLDAFRQAGGINLILLSPTGWAGEIENWEFSYKSACASDPLKNCGVSQHAFGYAGGLAPIKQVLADGFLVIETEFTAGPDVGNIGTQAQVLAAGVSGLMPYGSNAWGCSSASKPCLVVVSW